VSDFRILVIDRDPSTINYLQVEFLKLDQEILSAKTIKEGLILAYQNRPHVIIIDPILRENLQDFIGKIKRDWRLSRCKIIAFSSITMTDELQHALSLGFHHFFKKEGESVKFLIQKTLEAAEKARSGLEEKENIELRNTPEATKSELKAKIGKTIVFISGKGGIGTSSLCANVAHLSNINQEKNTILVDLVLPIGSLETIVGTTDAVDIVEASKLNNPDDIIPFLKNNLKKPPNWNFRILAGSDSPSRSDQLVISQIFIILDALKKFADLVFVDLGKTLSRISLPIIKSADQIVLTLSLDETTVAHTLEVQKFLKEQGVDQSQLYYLINRAVGLEGLSKSQVEEILGSVIQLAIPYMGGNFTLANNLHQPVSDKFPQDAVSISLRQASDDIIRKIEQRTSKMEFF